MYKLLLSLFFVFFLSIFLTTKVFSYYTNMPASVVVGQSSFLTRTFDLGGIGSQGMQLPLGNVTITNDSRMIIAECSNNRVTIFNSIPNTNFAHANVVVGQTSFTGESSDQGGSAAANTLDCPHGTTTDGTKLIIADRNNNRVLVYNRVPTSNNASADVVIGQPDFTTTSSGTTAAKTSLVDAVFFDKQSGKLFIVDRGNSRVLIYNQIPTENGVSADVVIGQADFVSGSTGTSSTRLSSGRSVHVVDGKVFVADDGNNRVLIWNTIPTTNGVAADVVIGQSSFTGGSANQGGSVTANTLSGPQGVFSDGKRVYVTDTNNNRLLIFNAIPSSNNTSADLVIGQPDFSSSAANLGATDPTANTLRTPFGVSTFNNQMFVTDQFNHRLLIFPNTLSAPNLGISSTETLSDGRIRIKGTVEVGERGRYSLSAVTASVNGEGYGNVSEMSGGRDNGVGNTLYDFTHEFSPWQNNGTKETWSNRGYVVRIKAFTSNAEESIAVLFSPFNFTLVSGDSTKPTFKFTVPSTHWSTLTDSLDSYEVQVKRSNESEYTTYLSSIPVSTSTNPLLNTTYDSSLGTITVSSKDKTLLPGSYTIRIIAKSKSGYSYPSNTISYTTDSKPSTFTPSTSSFHLSLTSISNFNPHLASYLKPITTDFYSKLNTTSTTFKGIAYSKSTITLTLIQQNCSPTNSTLPTLKTNNTTSTVSSSSCTHTYTTTTLPNSTFSLSIPNKDLIPNKKYTAFLTATLNKQESAVAPFSFGLQ